MMISFAPLSADAVIFLSARTSINFGPCDFTGPQWFCCTARNDDGEVRGVFVGEFTTWFEVHITTAVDDPAILSRRLLRVIFSTLFSRAVRITAMTRPDNDRSISGIRRLGFLYEGCSRMGIEGKWDALVFGMLRHECRWIRDRAELRKAA
jgi:hypothetical protein